MSTPLELQLAQDDEAAPDVIAELADVLGRLTPDLGTRIGSLAIGSDFRQEQWLHDLGQSVDVLRERLDAIEGIIDDRYAQEEGALLRARLFPEECIEVADSTEEPVVLSDLESQVYAYASLSGSFRVEEMRREVAPLKELTTEEYEAFKLQFGETRERIRLASEQSGVKLVWLKTGKARGTRYQLIATSELPETPEGAAVVTDAVGSTDQVGSAVRIPKRLTFYEALAMADQLAEDPPIQEVKDQYETTRERNAKFFKACRFIDRLITNLVEELALDRPEGVRRRDINAHIVKKLGNKVCAETLIADLREAGLLHRAHNTDGHVHLTTTEVQIDKKSGKDVETTGAQENDALRAEDIVIATRVFDSLLELKHVQQGRQTRKLMAELNIAKTDEPEFKRGLRRLVAAGVLIITQDSNVARSPHSKKLKVPIVRIASQKIKDQYQRNPNDFIDELRAKVQVVG